MGSLTCLSYELNELEELKGLGLKPGEGEITNITTKEHLPIKKTMSNSQATWVTSTSGRPFNYEVRERLGTGIAKWWKDLYVSGQGEVWLLLISLVVFIY